MNQHINETEQIEEINIPKVLATAAMTAALALGAPSVSAQRSAPTPEMISRVLKTIPQVTTDEFSGLDDMEAGGLLLTAYKLDPFTTDAWCKETGNKHLLSVFKAANKEAMEYDIQPETIKKIGKAYKHKPQVAVAFINAIRSSISKHTEQPNTSPEGIKKDIKEVKRMQELAGLSVK